MNTRLIIILLLGILAISSCQSTAPTPSAAEVAQTETKVASAIYAGLTLTAAAEEAAAATLTAAAPTPTSTPLPSPTINRVHINIPANACWVNTGIKIRSDQAVVMAASGVANTWGGKDISNGGPDGQTKHICGDARCPLLGAHYGALIGRVGQGHPFLVGSHLELAASEEGELFLTINDWECSDNIGNFTVTITIN